MQDYVGRWCEIHKKQAKEYNDIKFLKEFSEQDIRDFVTQVKEMKISEEDRIKLEKYKQTVNMWFLARKALISYEKINPLNVNEGFFMLGLFLYTTGLNEIFNRLKHILKKSKFHKKNKVLKCLTHDDILRKVRNSVSHLDFKFDSDATCASGKLNIIKYIPPPKKDGTSWKTISISELSALTHQTYRFCVAIIDVFSENRAI